MFIKEQPIGEKELTDSLLTLAKFILRYAIAALCWLQFAWSDTTSQLVRCPLDPHTWEIICPLIWVRQGSHHSMEMRLLLLGSLSHHNQVRLSWSALYCSYHFSKVLIVIWHLSFFSDWLKSKLEILVLVRFDRPFWQAGATCSRSSLAHAQKMADGRPLYWALLCVIL